MAIGAFTPSATPTPIGTPGDLVATVSFPCQPVSFFGPDGSEKYRKSYFETFGNTVWHHGDFVVFDAETRGITMLGRSDGILNPAGIRFGSAELYNILLKAFPEEVEDAVAVGRRREGEADEVVCLFIVMKNGLVVDDAFRGRVKKAVRDGLSIRHVPGVIEGCPEVPVTSNGKKVEVVVRRIVNGVEETGGKKVNGASVANEGSLQWFRDWAREKEDGEQEVKERVAKKQRTE